METTSLVLPGVLFVGTPASRDPRDEARARVVAYTGDAAGWFVPRGILEWSHEVSVVVREALTEDIRRSTKTVMPEEQIPPARMPLTHQAALKSPLVAVASKLAPKLVEAGIRVHTIGVDRVTSSFYYLAEGGNEEPARVEGDLVAAVGAMLGERADNAAIERVLDGLVDRLLRALSQNRVTELSLELAAALPRAAADGSGLADVDLESFERELSGLVAASERHASTAREIASQLVDTSERRLEIPLFKEARKASQGPFDLTVGERVVSLPTYERWVMAGPLTESEAKPAESATKEAPVAAAQEPPKPVVEASPVAVAPAPAATPKPEAAAAKPVASATPKPEAAAAKPAPTATPKPEAAKPVSSATPKPESTSSKAASSSGTTPRPPASPAKTLAFGATPRPSPASPPRPAFGSSPSRAEVEEPKPVSAPSPEPAGLPIEPMRVEVVAAIAGPVVEPVVAAPPVPVEAPPTVIVEPPPSEPASKEVPKETRSSSKVEAASSERAIVSTTKSSSDAKVDTARSKKHEPAPVEKKGGATLWIVLAILVVGGFAAWHFFGR